MRTLRLDLAMTISPAAIKVSKSFAFAFGLPCLRAKEPHVLGMSIVLHRS